MVCRRFFFFFSRRSFLCGIEILLWNIPWFNWTYRTLNKGLGTYGISNFSSKNGCLIDRGCLFGGGGLIWYYGLGGGRLFGRECLFVYEWVFFVYYDPMLFFSFLKSKNKKAAALPFVLAAPLDPEKGMDSNYSRTLVTRTLRGNWTKIVRVSGEFELSGYISVKFWSRERKFSSS